MAFGSRRFRPCPLRESSAVRHPRSVRHATSEDLDRLEPLLAELRAVDGLHERKRGYFSREGRALLHFHADADDFYVDVRVGGSFRRLRVSDRQERAAFLSLVRREGA